MDRIFQEHFRAIRELDITMDKESVSDANLPNLYSCALFGILPMLGARDPSRPVWEFWHDSRKDLAAHVKRAVISCRSPDFSAEDIQAIRSAVRGETSFPRLLLFYKMLEEIAIRSESEPVWREAMAMLAMPLYREKTEGLCGTDSESICASSLRNIAFQCTHMKKAFATEMLGGADKIDFASEIFSGSMFTPDLRREIRSAADVSVMDNDIALAALVAYCFTRKHPAPAAFEALARIGSRIDLEDGREHALSISRGDEYIPTSGPTHDRIVNGFAEILRTKPLPHPWFLPVIPKCGVPVPQLDLDGLQMQAFRTLAMMRSEASLMAAVDGTSNLVIPHIQGFGPEGVNAQPTVRRAVRPVAQAIGSLITKTGTLQPFQAELFTGILFAYPKRIPLDSVGNGQLLGISPLLLRIPLISHRLGTQDAPIAVISGAAFIRGLLAGESEDSREDESRKISRNIGTALELHGQVFGKTSVPDRDMALELIRRLSKTPPLMAIVRSDVRQLPMAGKR